MSPVFHDRLHGLWLLFDFDSVKRALNDLDAFHDRVQFGNPGRFDIGFMPNQHIVFGRGAHFCIGAMLARLEAKVALTELLGRVRELQAMAESTGSPAGD